MAERKRVDFYRKCQELKKQSTRRESSIYSEYSQIKFGEYWKAYERSFKESKEKGSSEMLEHHKADLIAFGSLSLIEEFEKACATVSRKKEFEELSMYSRKLAEEKSNKKIEISNLLSFIKRVTPLLKNRNP